MSKLTPLTYAPDAQNEINAIMDWNEKHYDHDHATRYLNYLLDQIGLQCRDPKKGHYLPARPDLRYVIIRRNSSGHGHIAVFRRSAVMIEIVHVFHTAQDWQQRLIDEATLE